MVAPSKIIKYALALEAGVTIAPAAALFLQPSLLPSFLKVPSSSVTQTVLDLSRIVGVITVGFAAMAGYAALDGPVAASMRKFVYATFGVAEVSLVGGALLMIGAKDAGRETGGIPAEGLWGLVTQLAPLVIWRTFALVVKPHWFGVDGARGKTA